MLAGSDYLGEAVGAGLIPNRTAFDGLYGELTAQQANARLIAALALAQLGETRALDRIRQAEKSEVDLSAGVAMRAAILVLEHLAKCPEFDELSRRRMLEDSVAGRPPFVQ